MSGQRGRPRQYDAETALAAASEVFWAQGFSDTSLDDLASAMNMNRPSIYRAFGDKEAIYRQTLAQFAQHMEAGFEQTLRREADVRKGLMRFYRKAVEVYTSGNQAKGCMVMCTAPAAAVSHPEVQADLLSTIQHLDAALSERFEQAVRDGQLHAATDSKALSKLSQAILHSLAIRARAGESKASLERMIRSAVGMLLGSP